MSSIRNLKKDVEYLVFEVVSDCITYSGLHPDTHTEAVTDIIEDAIELRNSLFTRINTNLRDEEGKTRKKHFSEIKKDLFSGIDSLFTRLSGLTKAD